MMLPVAPILVQIPTDVMIRSTWLSGQAEPPMRYTAAAAATALDIVRSLAIVAKAASAPIAEAATSSCLWSVRGRIREEVLSANVTSLKRWPKLRQTWSSTPAVA